MRIGRCGVIEHEAVKFQAESTANEDASLGAVCVAFDILFERDGLWGTQRRQHGQSKSPRK